MCTNRALASWEHGKWGIIGIVLTADELSSSLWFRSSTSFQLYLDPLSYTFHPPTLPYHLTTHLSSTSTHTHTHLFLRAWNHPISPTHTIIPDLTHANPLITHDKQSIPNNRKQNSITHRWCHVKDVVETWRFVCCAFPKCVRHETNDKILRCAPYAETSRSNGDKLYMLKFEQRRLVVGDRCVSESWMESRFAVSSVDLRWDCYGNLSGWKSHCRLEYLVR